ncbi:MULTISPECIES: hypothetical protein [Fibrobacter]|uniref:hypothetical protein n=1 Tax=Fibrobacter TaxID=832 RepID=UPI00156397DE|nr:MULTISPECIES: hypothetical protein [Fibrobacter]MBR4783700.1 hypothetical protein [Fibrobacter sp.]
MITPLHHSDYTLKNRAFNCRMRNRYYEEVYYAFRAVMPLDAKGDIDGSAMNLDWFKNLAQEINRLDRVLKTCLEYAQAAVFYGKADIATLYSKDKRWGILQEEIFLVHFLQELLSTTRYIIARMETDRILQQWSGSMQDMKAKPMNSGFVSSIQEKLTAMNNATIEEFKDLFKHIIDRFQIGNTLFGTVQELQNFY